MIITVPYGTSSSSEESTPPPAPTPLRKPNRVNPNALDTPHNRVNEFFINLSTLHRGFAATTELCIPKRALISLSSIETTVESLPSTLVTVKYARTDERYKGKEEISIEIAVLNLLKSHKHPGIVELVEFDLCQASSWIATRPLVGGTPGHMLEKTLAARAKIPPVLVWHVLVQMMEALAFLHGFVDANGRKIDVNVSVEKSNRRLIVAHNDIHPYNILFDIESQREFEPLPNIRVIDFGRATAAYSCQVRLKPADEASQVHFYDDVMGVRRLQSFKDTARDIGQLASVIHELVHPFGKKLHSVSGKCNMCICSPFASSSRGQPFGPFDDEFQALMEKMSDPTRLCGKTSCRIPLAAWDYRTISTTAEGRRQQAYQHVSKFEGMPMFEPTIGGSTIDSIKLTMTEVVEAAKEGHGELVRG